MIRQPPNLLSFARADRVPWRGGKLVTCMLLKAGRKRYIAQMMHSSSYPYVSHASLWGFTYVHVLNPSFPLRSAHVATTCQMQKYIYAWFFDSSMTEPSKGCCLNPRKWYSIIIFTQISTVTWCNLYVCTNHHSFGIPAKIHVYIIKSNEWAFSKNLLSLPAALLGNCHTLKGLQQRSYSLWSSTSVISMMFRPILDQHKDCWIECFRCFSKNSFSSLPGPALQRLGFANFRNHNSFWEF